MKNLSVSSHYFRVSTGIACNYYISDKTHFTMDTITITYKLKWQLKSNPKYKWSECGKLFNTIRGVEIKKTVNGNKPGYWIAGKFIRLEQMKAGMLQNIVKEKCPF